MAATVKQGTGFRVTIISDGADPKDFMGEVKAAYVNFNKIFSPEINFVHRSGLLSTLFGQPRQSSRPSTPTPTREQNQNR